MGILRVIHVDPNAVSDWIPVDVVANVCIAAAMATALAPQGTVQLPLWLMPGMPLSGQLQLTHNAVPSFPEHIVRERDSFWKKALSILFPNFLAKTCMHKMYVGLKKLQEISFEFRNLFFLWRTAIVGSNGVFEGSGPSRQALVMSILNGRGNGPRTDDASFCVRRTIQHPGLQLHRHARDAAQHESAPQRHNRVMA
jgi:hypothetical protein